MLTVNQENYCQARVKGLTQRQAYRAAYPRSTKWKESAVDAQACLLENNSKVSIRLKQLQNESAKAARLDKAKILKTLEKKALGASALLDMGMREDRQVSASAASLYFGAIDRLLPEIQKAEEKESKLITADFALMMQPDFFGFHRDLNSDITDYWLKGGRGSTKSSIASLEVVYWLERHQEQHGVALMKTGANLRTGVLSQIEWACAELGVANHWETRISPMEMTNTETGQKIFFRGCDDPKKLKSSIKPPFGHVGIVWFEEADLFRGMEEVRSINQTLSRGGKSKRIYTYNPPRSKHSWVNKHVFALDGGVYDSNYLNVPKEWLGDTFLEDALWLKAHDEQAYRHEYMGEPVGSGTDVFTNVCFREITDDEIKTFDNVKCGQDFGWYPDPWAYTESEWRQASRTLLTYYEDGGCKIQPKEQAERIAKHQKAIGLHEDVFSDDANPQDIAAQRDCGVRARAAEKGGMRDASYRFLQRVTWVIDPKRCPKLAEEVRDMQFEVTRDGEVLNTVPDGHDHYIDATRYATMRLAKSGRR